MVKDFEIIGDITNVETIAVGNSIRVIKRLKRFYSDGRWRKLKGVAQVKLPDRTVCKAEVHWYEMSRVGRKEVRLSGYYHEHKIGYTTLRSVRQQREVSSLTGST